MTLTIDLSKANKRIAPSSPAALSPSRPFGKLLIIQNPGRVSRHYMEGIIRGAEKLNIPHIVCELADTWQRLPADAVSIAHEMADLIKREQITAAIGYVFNGLNEFGTVNMNDGRVVSLFEALGVPHLMLWTDHPQWAMDKAAIQPQIQPLLRSRNNHHFLKSVAAAYEITRVLGWPNCHGLPVGEDSEIVSPAVNVQPEFDIVAVVGSPPKMDPRLEPFLEQDDPDIDAIMAVVAETVREKLTSLWQRSAPATLRNALTRMSEDWLARRCVDVTTAAVRHIDALLTDHRNAMSWLLDNPLVYFEAVEHLWVWGRWQRPFMLRYLARYFKVAVFGFDWSSVGIAGGGWVDYHEQSAAYARGRIAINISQGSEEEGVSHKPFQIAASGVPMLHIHRKGLSDCFEIGPEIEIFSTPRDAVEKIRKLLDDEPKRRQMADAARKRVESDHGWDRRLLRMLELANVPIPSKPAF